MKRGEIWLVDLNPTVGSEISKTRPVLIISSDAIGILPIKLSAPITGWQTNFENKPWLIMINPYAENKLTKVSAIDILQLRGLETNRFVKKIGNVSAQLMKQVTGAIAIAVEFE